MLNDSLLILNKKLIKYNELKTNRIEQEEQEKTNRKFSSLMKKSKDTLDLLIVLKDLLSYTVNRELIENLKVAFEETSQQMNQPITLKQCNKIRNCIDSINIEIKRNWQRVFSDYTSSVLGTLTIIYHTDPQKIEYYIREINKYQSFPQNKESIIQLDQQIKQAKRLIGKLNMNEKIVNFLNKINNGSATLIDLDDTILNWISQEKLENKIKLTM